MRQCTKCGWSFAPEAGMKSGLCRNCWFGTSEATAEPIPLPRMDISDDPVLQRVVSALVDACDNTEGT